MVITLLSYLCNQLLLLKKETNAAITIQRVWRRRAEERRRDNILLQQAIHRNESAALIQATVRSFLQRNRYLRLKQSASVIQQWWKRVAVARTIRTRYVKQRNAAILLQSYVRMRKVQRMVQSMHRAATSIQAVYKGWLQRRRYRLILNSIAVIQTRWKATLCAREYRQRYIHQISAIITIQSHYRRWQVQKAIAIENRSATIIQASFRRYLQQQRYHKLKRSVATIELYWQSCVLARRERAEYIRTRNAIVILQSHVRRWQAQQAIARQHKAAIAIQSMYKMYRQKIIFITILCVGKPIYQVFF